MKRPPIRYTHPLVSLAQRFAFSKRVKMGSNPQEQRHYAKLSDLAYKEEATRSQEAERMGLVYDTELSNPHAAVFNGNGQTVISFKGTDPTNFYDLSADASILLDAQGLHPRFRESVQHTRKVMDKYGSNVVLTGHSLGGSVADYVSKETDLPAVVYNPGSNPNGMANVSRNTTVYRHPLDMVSSGYGVWPVPVAVGVAGFGAGAHGVEQFYDQ